MMPDPILDHATIENLLAAVGGDKAFLAEMIDAFFADSPKQIAAMRKAVALTRAEDLRRAAHSLKSNAASFGAMKLLRLTKELEEMGRNGTLDGAIELITQIEGEYARVESVLGKPR